MDQMKLAEVGEIAELLSRELRTDRIPAAVRRPSSVLGGRSILEAIAAGDEADVLAALRAGFDWAATA